MAKRSKGAMLCPNCGKLISQSETECPYCGIKNPASGWKTNPWTRLTKSPYFLIKAIIIVNVAVYVFSLLLFPRGMGMSMNPLSLLSPSNDSLMLLGATGTFPIDRMGRWWSLLSANYLHGSILHIFFNMFAFRQIGTLVSREFGSNRMLTIYTLGGIGGFGISYVAGVTFTIGASAAVCSLIGATLYYARNRGGIYGQQLFRQVGGWVIALFLFGLLVPGINNWGHGGGLFSGALLALILGYQEKNRERLLHKIMGSFCAVMTVLVQAWAVFTTLIFRFFS